MPALTNRPTRVTQGKTCARSLSNLRSTVATTVPNFIRGTVVPLTLLFAWLRDVFSEHLADSHSVSQAQGMGILYGALVVGISTIVVALAALSLIDETYGRDLNFEEHA